MVNISSKIKRCYVHYLDSNSSSHNVHKFHNTLWRYRMSCSGICAYSQPVYYNNLYFLNLPANTGILVHQQLNLVLITMEKVNLKLKSRDWLCLPCCEFLQISFSVKLYSFKDLQISGVSRLKLNSSNSPSSSWNLRFCCK